MRCYFIFIDCRNHCTRCSLYIHLGFSLNCGWTSTTTNLITATIILLLQLFAQVFPSEFKQNVISILAFFSYNFIQYIGVCCIGYIPIVNHKFLYSNQSFISYIWIFMTQQLHDQLFTAKVLNQTRSE